MISYNLPPQLSNLLGLLQVTPEPTMLDLFTLGRGIIASVGIVFVFSFLSFVQFYLSSTLILMSVFDNLLLLEVTTTNL